MKICSSSKIKGASTVINLRINAPPLALTQVYPFAGIGYIFPHRKL